MELEDSFAGVKRWAVHYLHVRPSFEVFTYVGQDRARGLYFFQSRKDKNILYKSLADLEASIKDKTFKPFVLDTNEMTTVFNFEE